MVSSSTVVILSALLGLILLRKYRESRWGYFKSKKSLQGKVFLVTGANSGIGKETVRELARRDACVIMACRSMSSALSAIEDIRRTVQEGTLVIFHSVVNFRGHIYLLSTL